MGDIYDILCRYKRWDDPIDAVFTVFMINFCLSHVRWNLELRTWNWDRSPSDNPYNLQHIHSTMAICCVSRDQQTVFKISLVLRGEYSDFKATAFTENSHSPFYIEGKFRPKHLYSNNSFYHRIMRKRKGVHTVEVKRPYYKLD